MPSKSRAASKGTSHLPLLGITMGDPAGIGPEVIAKAMADKVLRRVCHPLVIGSFPVMQRAVRRLRLALKVFPVDGHDAMAFREGTMAVLDPLDPPLGAFKPGTAAKETGAASVAFI